MSAAYYPQVQKIYVAYYGRPADPAGLQYWAGQLAANGGNLTAIINAFGASTESTALYGGTPGAAAITSIYQQLFNRAPDMAGLTYYTGELTAGRMTAASIALNIANGATGTDATLISNKVIVGQAFTDALTIDGAAAIAYPNNIAAARSLITATTTSAATTGVASTVATIKSGSGGGTTPAAGQTFTLTADVANVTEGSSATFTVTRTGSTTDAVTLLYNVTGDGTTAGAATPGTDLTPISGTVTIPAGAASATFTLAAVSDAALEGLEGFKVSLFNSTTAAPLNVTRNGLITDDPNAPVPSQSFVLTASSNNFSGGSGDDTFDGALNSSAVMTFNSGDVLNGGAGNDTLTVTLNAAGTYQASTITSIETITTTFITTAGTLSLIGASGYTAINASGSTVDAAFSGINSTSVLSAPLTPPLM